MTASRSEDKRIALWDNLKILLIVLVVVGHLADCFYSESASMRALYLFIYTFHMPAFFFIAGLFHSDNNLQQKTLFYIAGVYVLQLILLIARVLFSDEPDYYFTLLGERGSLPWFLYALGVFNLIATLSKNKPRMILLLVFTVLTLCAGYCQQIGNFLVLSRLLYFSPFYLAGTMFDPSKLARKPKPWISVLGTLFLFLLFLLSFLKTDYFASYRYLLNAKSPYPESAGFWAWVPRLLALSIGFLATFSLIAIGLRRRIPILTNQGQYTLNVMCWHWPLYLFLDHFFHVSAMFEQGPLGKLLFILLAIPISFVIATPLFDFPMKHLQRVINNLVNKSVASE